ncbi:GntR family transcriptional regulator [Streptomyces sp. NBC_01433]|uniref:GntR family transcriptional regulator n=1 Tax=Streptomyces sp. NBC_01433 TaxID=2903864 RepID=UPI002258C913|nr:GntR family transcriptional regulator [Streptomyces sp. NBC_01433]MCX4681572.1 GntR family transcriptional regulator [Streptomyces sp. NBC_01433]
MDLSTLPQHQKAATVARILHAEILEGRYGADGQLPTEPELVKRFGVARETVRRALQLLKESGVVMSVQGSGTFVRRRPRRTTLHRELQPQGGPADWIDHGSESWVPLGPPASWSRGEVPVELADSIGLEGQVAIWTCALGIDAEPRVPLRLVRTYVPVDVVEGLPNLGSAASGGSAVLERLAQAGAELFWTLSDGARMPELSEATALDSPIGIPLIQTLRITRQGGTVIEATEYVVSSERFCLTYRPDQDANGLNLD